MIGVVGFYSKEYIVKINYDENVPLEEYLWRFSIEITIVIKNERTICCVCQYEKHFCMFKRNTCTLIKGCNIQLWPKWKINNHNYHIEKGFFSQCPKDRGDLTLSKFDNYGFLLFMKDIMTLLFCAMPKR